MKRIIKNFICLLCFAVMATGLPALAQQEKIQIKGTVTSLTDKEPLIGVAVAELDKDGRIVNGQATDMDGVYTIKVTPGNRLSFSYLGFESQKLDLNSRTVINVVLKEESQQALGGKEVEVFADRTVSDGVLSISARDMTGSVSRIDARELEGIQAASIDEALQGRLTGVDIVATSGDPGQGMQIRIRGTNSLNGDNQPLIVINGVPFETQIDPDFDFANADENQYGALISVAPEDIKEISVAKDAAATAIWGNRAANGVLNIITKRGSRGVPKITYRYANSTSKQGDAIPMLNGDQYATLVMDMLNNQPNGTPFDPVRYKEFTYDPNDPYYFNNFGQNTDWVGAVKQTAVTNDHTLTLSGGGEKATYRLSLGYMNQGGTSIGTALTRLSTRLALDYTVSDKIKFLTDFAYSRGDQDRNYSGVLNHAYTKMPNMSIYEYQQNAEGAWVQTPNYFIPQTISGATQWNVSSNSGSYNPVAMANIAVDNYISESMSPQFTLNYQIAKWLKYQGVASFSVNNAKTKRFLPQEVIGSNFTGLVNYASDAESESFGIGTFTRFWVTPYLGEAHSLSFFLSYSTNESSNRSSGITSANSPTSMMRDPSIPSRVKNSALGASSSEGKSRSVSAVWQTNYSLLDRYIFSSTIRRDGNYRFAPQERFKIFPAFSGRWRISGEPFMRSLTNRLKIDDFSLRASWGINSNGGASNQYNQYNALGYEYLGSIGIVPSNIAIQALKWERTFKTNLETNLDMFKGRLSLGFSYYSNKTVDMLANDLSISTTSGFTGVSMNAGSLKNEGWEFNINTQIIKKTDFKVDFNFNIARNQNMLTELSPKYKLTQGNMDQNGNYFQTLRVNNPVGSFYGYRYLGVYANEDQLVVRNSAGEPIYVPDGAGGWSERMMTFYSSSSRTSGYNFKPGDAIYDDVNNDGNIDIQDVVYLGNSQPKYQGGFGPTISYKQFRVALFFNYRYGNDIVNQIKMNLEKMTDLSNQSTAVLKRWRYPYANPADQPSDIIPRPVWGSTSAYNYLGSDRYVEDGSFVRLNSITFRYNLPKNLLSKMKMKEAYLTFNMRNCFVWTKYTGQDPEVGYGGPPFAMAYDGARTPKSKEYQLTLNVTF